ncbi:MauE/DoxX family redox-associated membrane protein [uncultured Photobacterium sp.]|uniref:MauE/DoxX family redox-associated membrane protein n=1 Tax=uncultured Photobacterium sp. TaxID=173973 RepID=UPI0026017767|nr:MauE/DoxX family redox-associated membrane protein [uncultured Photobacterium sp.]
MKTHGYFHRFVTSLVLMSAAAIALKGFFMPEQTALLLKDTGLAPSIYSSVIAFALPLALTVCGLLAVSSLTTVAPVVCCLGIYMALSGLALYQGLHFDCGCYLPGSVQSQVYSQLEPQFLIQALITAVAGGLYVFNLRFMRCTTMHTA